MSEGFYISTYNKKWVQIDMISIGIWNDKQFMKFKLDFPVIHMTKGTLKSYINDNDTKNQGPYYHSTVCGSLLEMAYTINTGGKFVKTNEVYYNDKKIKFLSDYEFIVEN